MFYLEIPPEDRYVRLDGFTDNFLEDWDVWLDDFSDIIPGRSKDFTEGA